MVFWKGQVLNGADSAEASLIEAVLELIPPLGSVGNKAAETGLSPWFCFLHRQQTLLTCRAGLLGESRWELADWLLCIPYSVHLKFSIAEINIKKKRKK